jgi:uncharacterized protein DUF6544
MNKRFAATVAAADLHVGPGNQHPVTESDLATLPDVARRYLGFMGVVGRPRDWSFRARFSGRFRRKPNESWMRCEAWQYNTTPEIARIFYMRVMFARVVPMIGRDTYVRGRGRMQGKLFDLFTVADGRGEEFDIGELVTFLNDAVLLAPSMLLSPATTWVEVDDESFDVTLADAGRRVTARVFVDERGAPRDFSTTDRFASLPQGAVRAPWTTPIESWSVVDGRPFPGPATAIWHLPEGEFSYIEGRFVPGSVAYDVRPE